MLFKQVREIFLFTRKERNGMLFLLALLFLCLCLDISLPYLLPEKEYDVSAWKSEAEKQFAKDSSKRVVLKPVFAELFDPNLATLDELQKMDVPEGIAANWMKYLQKGGRFKSREEVMKLYGMTEILYRKIEKNLKNPEKPPPMKFAMVNGRQTQKEFSAAVQKDTLRKFRRFPNTQLPLLEINQADSAQLEALPGIGPVLAGRIVKYRRLLGGFYEVSQLKEIYGMTEELWARASPKMVTDTSGIRKLDVNFLSVSELGRHPYIGFRQAKKIVKKRDMEGKFRSEEELALLFSTDSMKHLSPYLSLLNVQP